MWFLSRERGRKKKDLSEERSPNSLHFGEEYKIEGHLVKFKVPRAECLCGSSKVYVRTVALAWCWHLSPSIFQGYSEKPEAGLHHKLSLTETDWLNLHLFLKDKHTWARAQKSTCQCQGQRRTDLYLQVLVHICEGMRRGWAFLRRANA